METDLLKKTFIYVTKLVKKKNSIIYFTSNYVRKKNLIFLSKLFFLHYSSCILFSLSLFFFSLPISSFLVSSYDFLSSFIFFPLLFYTMPIEFIPEPWARWHAASFYFINYWNTWIPVSFIRVSPRIFISSSFNSGVWHFTDCVPATMAGRARNARGSAVTRRAASPMKYRWQ